MKRALFFLLLLLILGCQPAPPHSSIAGLVLDEDRMPIAGAVVRVKATEKSATTDEEGKFALLDLPNQEPVLLTAWAQGYYIGGGQEKYTGGTTNVRIVLKRHPTEDHPSYQWMSAFTKDGKAGNCENCHADPKNPDAALPFSEWRSDAHALSAKNPRFLTMYLGQDIHGNQSPPTVYVTNRDYGLIPLKPDLAQPYFGPGYKLDFPETAGNCTACHVPAAAIDAAYETDLAQVTGIGTEGVTCDFCHKVWDVRLDSSTGLPRSNMPGVLSFEFRRPGEGHQFFAGPFDDVAPGEDTYTPIQRQSQFCAPCHFGSFWGTPIYNSFGEWLESPYSNAESGKTCQDCHMPAGKNDHIAGAEKGGIVRDPQTIFSHFMPGASNTELLQNAVTLLADAKIEGNQLVVEVKVTNDKTGHHVPTDSPLRQLILLVSAMDKNERALTQLEGETIPEWGGVGDPGLGYYAGLPGKGYAKILSELWTEITPAGSYWNPTQIVSDNRIPAFATDRSTYKFAAPEGGKASVKITLLFRRAFRELMDQKGWDVPDILMEQQTLTIDH